MFHPFLKLHLHICQGICILHSVIQSTGTKLMHFRCGTVWDNFRMKIKGDFNNDDYFTSSLNGCIQSWTAPVVKPASLVQCNFILSTLSLRRCTTQLQKPTKTCEVSILLTYGHRYWLSLLLSYLFSVVPLCFQVCTMFWWECLA